MLASLCPFLSSYNYDNEDEERQKIGARPLEPTMILLAISYGNWFTNVSDDDDEDSRFRENRPFDNIP